MVVEHPANSGDLWIATDSSVVADHPGGATPMVWNKCATEVEGSPCAGFDALGIPFMGTWNPSVNVSLGEVYEYPPASGLYYEIVVPFNHPTMVGAPGVDLDAWGIFACPCKETWFANGQPVWDPNNNGYPGNFVVEWPAGSQNLYISESGGLTSGAGEPGVDNHWMSCNGSQAVQESTDCAGLEVVGVWGPGMNVSFGEVYEYPANSGMFYSVVIPFLSPTNVGAPGLDLDAWEIANCPCKETWNANGMPVWDASQFYYPGNYVVEWPASSGVLYISEGGGLTGAGEPGVDGHWMPCDQTPAANDGPCNGFDGNFAGTWSPSVEVNSGDVYEYPASSGIFYEVVIQGYTNQVTNSPLIDMDVWASKVCPCKETWNDNGMPVWDATQMNYPGNYVVEWPASSGVLYISEGGGLTGSIEPGTDGHWLPCSQLDPSTNSDGMEKSDSDDDSVPSIGMFGTIVAVSLGFFIATRREQ